MRLLVIALIAGVFLNVLVAWVAAYRFNKTPLGVTHYGDNTRWPTQVPAHWPESPRHRTGRAFGVTLDAYDADVKVLQRQELFALSVWSHGWPCPGLRQENWTEAVIAIVDGRPVVTQNAEHLPPDRAWVYGLPIPILTMSGWDWMPAPIRPIWPGFAINTLLYAAVVWGLLTGIPRLRCFFRLRAGLCPACKYPIGNSPVCTECGRTVPGRRQLE